MIGSHSESIDGSWDFEPQVHIFVESKAPQYDRADSLPQLERAPPGSGIRALEGLQ